MSEKHANPAASQGSGEPSPPKPSGLSRRWLLGILVLAFLFVLMPFLFWRATWFGRPLTDEEIARNLADREHPRKVQHALSQIADHILSRDAAARASARSWYPEVTALSASDRVELRAMAAWVMGQDSTEPRFQEALHRLLGDANPMVQRNAALSLVRFGDAAGRGVIRGLLQPYAVKSPAEGILRQRLKPEDTTNPGTLLARIDSPQGKIEVRAEVPGKFSRWLVGDGSVVSQGAAIAAIEPSAEEQWEGLRALHLIGQAEDLPLVETLSRSRAEIPDSVRRQAELTARAIRERSKP